MESAVVRPQTTVFGADAYPTAAEKAAALLESLVRNHALVDGNKRLGWLATETFLALNGVRVGADDDVLFDLVIGVAEGRFSGVPELTAAIADLAAAQQRIGSGPACIDEGLPDMECEVPAVQQGAGAAVDQIVEAEGDAAWRLEATPSMAASVARSSVVIDRPTALPCLSTWSRHCGGLHIVCLSDQQG